MFRYILTSFLLASMVVGAPVSAGMLFSIERKDVVKLNLHSPEWDADLATRENFYTLMRLVFLALLRHQTNIVVQASGLLDIPRLPRLSWEGWLWLQQNRLQV